MSDHRTALTASAVSDSSQPVESDSQSVTARLPRAVSLRGSGPDSGSCPIGTDEAAIDIGLALSLLADAVHERGEGYVYRPIHQEEGNYLTCLYAQRGTPDCLVGVVLARAGVSGRDLERLRDDGVRELYLAGALPITITLGALLVLHAAQLAQDRGRSWGEALGAAEAAASSFLLIVPNQAIRKLVLENA